MILKVAASVFMEIESIFKNILLQNDFKCNRTRNIVHCLFHKFIIVTNGDSLLKN